jgi:peptidoglycan/xylan/chitin deacetylase (PgdA/CDA1 family)
MLLPRHNRYDYSIINRRPDYSWPDGKRLAFWIGTNIEVFAFQAGIGHDATKPGEPQTQRNFAWRDYGNRVGVWRLFDLYDELKLPNSCVVNSYLYDYHPEILERARARKDDVIGHGRTNAEKQKGLWESDERRLIDDVTSTIEKHEGARPKGWLGAGAAETNVTLDLLKEAGYTYVLDWPADDQPIWLNTRSGKILSVPYPLELNDAGQLIHRQHNTREFCDMIVDQFDEMTRQCVDQPLVCCISLHAYLVGQPFRLAPLRRALQHIAEHKHRDRVWYTRAGDIADYCYAMKPGIIPGS